MYFCRVFPGFVGSLKLFSSPNLRISSLSSNVKRTSDVGFRALMLQAMASSENEFPQAVAYERN